MTTVPLIRAIDIGYGNTKFVTRIKDNTIHCDLLPSRAPLLERSAMGDDGLVSGRQTVAIPVDGRLYEVGEDTALFKGPPILHDDYTETPEYLALYRACLGRMNASRIDAIITGLPVTQLAQKQDALMQRLSGEHPVGEERIVEVRSVKVFAQPLGGLIDHRVARDGAWTPEKDDIVHLIVDAGYYTLDWVVAKGLAEVPGLCGTYDTGVSHVLQAIAKDIGDTTGRPYNNLARLDRGLREGALEVRGETTDLAEYLKRTDTVWTNALTELKNNVGDGSEFDRITLVGGGARLVRPHIQRLYPKHSIESVTDSVFANVRGFQTIGHAFQRSLTAA